MSTILIFLIVIIVLVVAHELGHFFVAKAFRVRVDEFGVGYPPRARKLFTWRGTLFTLNWLPFGGFVKITGEEISDSENKTSSEEEKKKLFTYQSMWKRVLIIAAGILANTVLAMALYAASFGIGFLAAPGDFPGSIPLGPDQTIITSVLEKSPASEAGLATGDVITSLSSGADSVVVRTVEEVVLFIKNHSAGPVTITAVRAGTTREFTATPKSGVVGTAPGIGVSLAIATPVRLPFLKALGAGVTYTFSQFKSTVYSLGMLVVGAFRGNTNLLSQVSGPVGIAQIAGQAYALGFGSFLAFVALISVNLAVINLLPFPALDGGRIILELFSRGGKSRIPARVVSTLNQIGFLLLILLMLFVTYHDIRHLFA